MFVNVAALRAGQPGRGESGSSREGPRVTVGGRLCLWLSAVAFALLAKTPSPVGAAVPSGCVWRLARRCPRPRRCVSGRPCPCGTPAPPVCAPLPVHPGPHAPPAGVPWRWPLSSAALSCVEHKKQRGQGLLGPGRKRAPASGPRLPPGPSAPGSVTPSPPPSPHRARGSRGGFPTGLPRRALAMLSKW